MLSFILGDPKKKGAEALHQQLQAENADVAKIFDEFKEQPGVINEFFLQKKKANELTFFSDFLKALTFAQQLECVELMGEDIILYLFAIEHKHQRGKSIIAETVYLNSDFLPEAVIIALIKKAPCDLINRRFESINHRDIMIPISPNALAAMIRTDTLSSFLANKDKLFYFLATHLSKYNYLEAVMTAFMVIFPNDWEQHVGEMLKAFHTDTLNRLIKSHQSTFLVTLVRLASNDQAIINVMANIPAEQYLILLYGSQVNDSVMPPIFSMPVHLFIQLATRKISSTANINLHEKMKDLSFSKHLINYLISLALDQRYQFISSCGLETTKSIFLAINRDKKSVVEFSKDERLLNVLLARMPQNYNQTFIESYLVFYQYAAKVMLLTEPTPQIEVTLDFINRFHPDHLLGLAGFAQAELSCNNSPAMKLLLEMVNFLIIFDPQRLARGTSEDNQLLIQEIEARQNLVALHTLFDRLDFETQPEKSHSYLGSALSYASMSVSYLSSALWAPAVKTVKLNNIKNSDILKPADRVLFEVYESINFCLFTESGGKQQRHNITCWSIAQKEIKFKLNSFMQSQWTKAALPWADELKAVYPDLYAKLPQENNKMSF